MVKKNIAVIGCGYWGKNLVRNFAQLGALNTICDENSELVKKIASSYPEVNIETEYDSILENDEIKAVVIATPAALHYTMVRKALLCGKDVVVEKPFATSTKDAEELAELSHQKDRIVMVGHLLLYHPAVQMMKDIIQSRVLGDIYYLYSTRVNLGQVRHDEDALWRLVPHDIAMFIYLLDAYPEVISAQGSSYIQPKHVDVVFVNLRFGTVMAHVHASWLDPHKIRQLTVVGSKKMVVFDDMEPEYKLQLYDKEVHSETLSVSSGEAVFPRVQLAEPLHLECKEFIECINEHRQPLSDAQMGLEVVRALETAQQSMQEEE